MEAKNRGWWKSHGRMQKRITGAGAREREAQARAAGVMDILATLAASGFSETPNLPRPAAHSRRVGNQGPLWCSLGAERELSPGRE